MPLQPLEATQFKQLTQLERIANAVEKTNRLLQELLALEQRKSPQESEVKKTVGSPGSPRTPK